MNLHDPAAASRSPELLLGVDGGGSTTQAVVADLKGQILGRGLGPACNQHKVGVEFATRALATAIEGALGHVVGLRAGDGRPWTRARIAAACFGLAGVDNDGDREHIAGWIRAEAVCSDAVVVNDSELVLSGGTPEGWGVGLISGTGSICLGRTREGRSARGPEDLIRHVYRKEMSLSDVSQLAIGIQEMASRGNTDALALVDRAAKALAQQVDAVVNKLRLKQPPLALGGAVLRASLKKSLLAHLQVEVGPVALVHDPVQAAVTIAQRRTQRAA